MSPTASLIRTRGGSPRLLMNFSNLSFFNDRYSKDSDGNTITDSSCGGVSAYAVLASMPNVDSSRSQQCALDSSAYIF